MPTSPAATTEGGLADRLREATRELHLQAEQSGVIAQLVDGRARPESYALWLRNLLPVYRELEAALEQHRLQPGLASLCREELYRSTSIEADLDALCGADWGRRLAALEPARRYAARVRTAATGDGGALVAHAYVRYLGDLNGGRLVRDRLEKGLGLPDRALGFYDYPGIERLGRFARAYRAAIDDAAAFFDPARLAEEARAAFQLNIELSEAVAG